MEETGAIPDKKFEGYSNLKGKNERQEKRAQKKENASKAGSLDEEFIRNLMQQIATMEIQIKALKDREIDQKNKASGYETLLRDGIPLNEHFLALKNKYNNEQQDLKKQVEIREHELDDEKRQNDDKRTRIRNMKADYDRVAEDFRKEREAKERELKT